MRIVLALFTLAAVVVAPPVQRQWIDNPYYQSWAQYKPGTTAVLKVTMVPRLKDTSGTTKVNAQDTALEVTLASKLLEVTGEGAVIETTLTTNVDGKPKVVVEKRTIPAKVETEEIDNLGLMASTSNLRLKETKTGTDTIEVKGEKVQAVTREQTFDSRLQPLVGRTAKAWYVAKVPGAIVRMQWHDVRELEKGILMETEAAGVLVDYTIVK